MNYQSEKWPTKKELNKARLELHYLNEIMLELPMKNKTEINLDLKTISNQIRRIRSLVDDGSRYEVNDLKIKMNWSKFSKDLLQLSRKYAVLL